MKYALPCLLVVTLLVVIFPIRRDLAISLIPSFLKSQRIGKISKWTASLYLLLEKSKKITTVATTENLAVSGSHSRHIAPLLGDFPVTSLRCRWVLPSRASGAPILAQPNLIRFSHLFICETRAELSHVVDLPTPKWNIPRIDKK